VASGWFIVDPPFQVDSPHCIVDATARAKAQARKRGPAPANPRVSRVTGCHSGSAARVDAP